MVKIKENAGSCNICGKLTNSNFKTNICVAISKGLALTECEGSHTGKARTVKVLKVVQIRGMNNYN